MSLSYMNIADPATYVKDEAQRLFDELLNDINSEFYSLNISKITFVEGIIDLENRVEFQYQQNVQKINAEANMFSKEILIEIQRELKNLLLNYLNTEKKFFVGGARTGGEMPAPRIDSTTKYSYPVATDISFQNTESFDDLINKRLTSNTKP